MKALMIFGALIGFLIGCAPALMGLNSWPTALWRASAAALAAGLLTRWWTGVWLEGLRNALTQRRHRPPVPTPNLKPATKP